MTKRPARSAASAAEPATPSRGRTLDRIEAGLAISLAVATIAARFVFLAHAGPLWRDEVTSVNIAAQDSLRATLDAIRFDSFPALWDVVLHFWTAAGIGGSDMALRVLGVLLGFASIAAACWAVAALGGRWPLLTLALLALSPTAISWGCEVRGYAIGLAALLILLPTYWALARSRTRATIALAAVAALLAVHSSFSSPILLFAISLAAAVVAVGNGGYRAAVPIVAIGAACALSMLAYVPMFASIREWNVIVQNPKEWNAIVQAWKELAAMFPKLVDALGGAPMTVLWAALLVVAVRWCVARLRRSPAVTEGDRSVARFLAIATLAGSVGYVVYLVALHVPTQTWYYLPMMGLLVVLIDVGVDRTVRESPRGRWVRLAVVVAAVAILGHDAARAARMRMTNVDRLAEALRTHAGPDDLIVLTPWYAGVSFHRYYRGTAPWVTVPDFSERRYQMFGELKRKMAQADPNRALFDRIARTLESGHKIWLTEDLPYLGEGEQPETLPPAPGAPMGWFEGAYEWTWLRQTAYIIQSRAEGFKPVTVKLEGPANPFENLPLYSVEIPNR